MKAHTMRRACEHKGGLNTGKDEDAESEPDAPQIRVRERRGRCEEKDLMISKLA